MQSVHIRMNLSWAPPLKRSWIRLWTHSLIFFLVSNLVNPVVLYIILLTWPASCHVFVKWPVGRSKAGGPRWATHLAGPVLASARPEWKHFCGAPPLNLFRFLPHLICWLNNLCETDITIRVSVVLHYATLTIRTSVSLISLRRKTVTPAALQMALLLIFVFKNYVSF